MFSVSRDIGGIPFLGLNWGKESFRFLLTGLVTGDRPYKALLGLEGKGEMVNGLGRSLAVSDLISWLNSDSKDRNWLYFSRVVIGVLLIDK